MKKEVKSMGKIWDYIPNNKEKLENLEVLINENNMNGLFVQYNGIHADRLHEFFSLNESAKYFTTKFFHNNNDKKITFTDSHGRRVDSINTEAVFFSFETIHQDEIIEMIKYLAYCCANQDLNINMTIHLGHEEFDIVADRDDKEYIAVNDRIKGISFNQIDKFAETINVSKSSRHK